MILARCRTFFEPLLHSAHAVAPATIEVGIEGGAANGGFDKSYLDVRSYLAEEDKSYLWDPRSYLCELRSYLLER